MHKISNYSQYHKPHSILLSGHVRNWKDNIDELLDLKEKLNADIFLFCYKETGLNTKYWTESTTPKTPQLSSDEILNILDILKPRAFKFIPERDLDHLDIEFKNCEFKNHGVKVHPSNIAKMFYMMRASNNLKNHFSMNYNTSPYQLVFRGRFDAQYNLKLLFPENNKQICGVHADINEFISDVGFYGENFIMNEVLLLYDKLLNRQILFNTHINAEDLLTQHIANIGANIKFLPNSEIKLRDKIFT